MPKRSNKTVLSETLSRNNILRKFAKKKLYLNIFCLRKNQFINNKDNKNKKSPPYGELFL